MQSPNKTPREARKLAQGIIGFGLSERNLNTKEIGSQQGNPAIVPVTMAGAHLCRRFFIRPAIADLVASLAGLGPHRGMAS